MNNYAQSYPQGSGFFVALFILLRNIIAFPQISLVICRWSMLEYGYKDKQRNIKNEPQIMSLANNPQGEPSK